MRSPELCAGWTHLNKATPSEAKMSTREEMSEGTTHISEMEPRARRLRDAKSGTTCRMDTSQQGDPSGAEKSTKEGTKVRARAYASGASSGMSSPKISSTHSPITESIGISAFADEKGSSGADRRSETTATLMGTSAPSDEEEIEERRLLDPFDETRSLVETITSLGGAQDVAA